MRNIPASRTATVSCSINSALPAGHAEPFMLAFELRLSSLA